MDKIRHPHVGSLVCGAHPRSTLMQSDNGNSTRWEIKKAPPLEVKKSLQTDGAINTYINHTE
jgi:hypothetical protein